MLGDVIIECQGWIGLVGLAVFDDLIAEAAEFPLDVLEGAVLLALKEVAGEGTTAFHELRHLGRDVVTVGAVEADPGAENGVVFFSVACW